MTTGFWVGTCGTNPTIPRRSIASVERGDKLERVADLLPQVFTWARAADARQPLTSGVWDGEWADPGSRTTIQNIQLANSDVISFHSYAGPSTFESRIGELTPHGRPILCTEYMARPQGSTIENILPVAKRHNVGAINWGLVAGKTQTYFPWDSWKHPYSSVPKVWFHDLLRPDGTAFQGSESQTIRTLSASTAG